MCQFETIKEVMSNMEERLYKMGVYVGRKLVFKTEVYATSIVQAREFAFENFEIYAYVEEIEEEEKENV